MTSKTFFLKDICSENYRQSLSGEDQASLDVYLHERKQGPADGEMDIAWQENGQGYYRHEYRLDAINDATERARYLTRLKEDVALWLADDPDNHMVRSVRDSLFKA
jgi:hypothetical protein